MATSIALLKGINVGGNNKIPMKELRELFSSLGFSDVQTLIQSGNVVFSHTKNVTKSEIEKAIAAQFSVTTNVIVRSSSQLQTIVKANPYDDVDTNFVHFGFSEQPIAPAAVAALGLEAFAPESMTVKKDQVYFYLPNGMGKSKLAEFAIRRLKVPITVRNWNTVNKLIALTQS